MCLFVSENLFPLLYIVGDQVIELCGHTPLTLFGFVAFIPPFPEKAHCSQLVNFRQTEDMFKDRQRGLTLQKLKADMLSCAALHTCFIALHLRKVCPPSSNNRPQTAQRIFSSTPCLSIFMNIGWLLCPKCHMKWYTFGGQWIFQS